MKKTIFYTLIFLLCHKSFPCQKKVLHLHKDSTPEPTFTPLKSSIPIIIIRSHSFPGVATGNQENIVLKKTKKRKVRRIKKQPLQQTSQLPRGCDYKEVASYTCLALVLIGLIGGSALIFQYTK